MFHGIIVFLFFQCIVHGMQFNTLFSPIGASCIRTTIVLNAYTLDSALRIGAFHVRVWQLENGAFTLWKGHFRILRWHAMFLIFLLFVSLQNFWCLQCLRFQQFFVTLQISCPKCISASSFPRLVYSFSTHVSE